MAWGELLFGSYFRTSVYPASSRAFSYSSFASRNSCFELEMVVNLFCMELGMFFRIDGGWFEALFTYEILLLGFL